MRSHLLGVFRRPVGGCCCVVGPPKTHSRLGLLWPFRATRPPRHPLFRCAFSREAGSGYVGILLFYFHFSDFSWGAGPGPGSRVPARAKSFAYIKPNFLPASSCTINISSPKKLQQALDSATRLLPIPHCYTGRLLRFSRPCHKISVTSTPRTLEIPVSSPRSRTLDAPIHLFKRATPHQPDDTAVYVFHALRQRFQTSAASQAANISHTSDTL